VRKGVKTVTELWI